MLVIISLMRRLMIQFMISKEKYPLLQLLHRLEKELHLQVVQLFWAKILINKEEEHLVIRMGIDLKDQVVATDLRKMKVKFSFRTQRSTMISTISQMCKKCKKKMEASLLQEQLKLLLMKSIWRPHLTSSMNISEIATQISKKES